MKIIIFFPQFLNLYLKKAKVTMDKDTAVEGTVWGDEATTR